VYLDWESGSGSRDFKGSKKKEKWINFMFKELFEELEASLGA